MEREETEGLPACLTRAPLDLLLLDNTYANPAYAFPTRAEAAAEVVRLITEVGVVRVLNSFDPTALKKRLGGFKR